MSGHSKWATIKHQKGAKDKARGKQFAKLIRQVEVAAREGGGDLDANATLRTMYAKARSASVPLDTIERAIKRGTGELEGVRYDAITYEGYGAAGVALLVEVLTDNRNRTGAEIRSTFTKAGGNIAEPGAVAWQFHRHGVISVGKSVDEDQLTETVLEAGGDDVIGHESGWEVRCAPGEVESVAQTLRDKGVEVDQAESMLLSDNLVPLTSEDDARKLLRLIEALEDLDDVQHVWSNFDISEQMLEKLAG